MLPKLFASVIRCQSLNYLQPHRNHSLHNSATFISVCYASPYVHSESMFYTSQYIQASQHDTRIALSKLCCLTTTSETFFRNVNRARYHPHHMNMYLTGPNTMSIRYRVVIITKRYYSHQLALFIIHSYIDLLF